MGELSGDGVGICVGRTQGVGLGPGVGIGEDEETAFGEGEGVFDTGEDEGEEDRIARRSRKPGVRVGNGS